MRCFQRNTSWGLVVEEMEGWRQKTMGEVKKKEEERKDKECHEEQ